MSVAGIFKNLFAWFDKIEIIARDTRNNILVLTVVNLVLEFRVCRLFFRYLLFESELLRADGVYLRSEVYERHRRVDDQSEYDKLRNNTCPFQLHERLLPYHRFDDDQPWAYDASCGRLRALSSYLAKIYYRHIF